MGNSPNWLVRCKFSISVLDEISRIISYFNVSWVAAITERVRSRSSMIVWALVGPVDTEFYSSLMFFTKLVPIHQKLLFD